MDVNRLIELLRRYKANELSGAEAEEWSAVVESEELRGTLLRLMENELDLQKATENFDTAEWKQVFTRIMQTDQPVANEVSRTGSLFQLRKWGWVAASVLIMLSAGAYFLLKEKEKPETGIVRHNEVGPGKEGAVLTLADGRQVVLDSLGNGIVATENGSQVLLRNGELSYVSTQKTGEKVVYNTMSTPRGRQFRITLPDGTQVWLNAASTIRFPVEFDPEERRVEVTGEVYFEVNSLLQPLPGGKTKKVPFIVNVNKKAELEVLGTIFNVSAYSNEQVINATLLEGAVRVHSLQTSLGQPQNVVLMPGQQALVQNHAGSEEIVVREADTKKVMAWKSGLFDFENVSLVDAMLQLERWYDIDVEYEKGIPQIWFSGKMSRDISLDGLLKILGKTGVRFRMEGRTLVVLPEK